VDARVADFPGETVGEVLRRLPGALSPGRSGLVAAVTVALRAEPFDAGALTAILDRQSEIAAGVQSAGRDVVVARIATMTPQERAAFADRIETQIGRNGAVRVSIEVLFGGLRGRWPGDPLT
jgi:hypothetical protein